MFVINWQLIVALLAVYAYLRCYSNWKGTGSYLLLQALERSNRWPWIINRAFEIILNLHERGAGIFSAFRMASLTSQELIGER